MRNDVRNKLLSNCVCQILKSINSLSPKNKFVNYSCSPESVHSPYLMKRWHRRPKQSILFDINKQENCLRTLRQCRFCVRLFAIVLPLTAEDTAASEISRLCGLYTHPQSVSSIRNN